MARRVGKMDEEWEREYQREQEIRRQREAEEEREKMESEQRSKPNTWNPQQDSIAHQLGLRQQQQQPSSSASPGAQGMEQDDPPPPYQERGSGGGSEKGSPTGTPGQSSNGPQQNQNSFGNRGQQPPPPQNQGNPDAGYLLQATIGKAYGNSAEQAAVEAEPLGNPRAFPQPGQSHDGRFLLPFVGKSDAQQRLMGGKIGRLVYFAEDAEVYFKGFMSANHQPMFVFATPRTVWIADPKSGEIVIARIITQIRSLVSIGENKAAICGALKYPDVLIRFPAADIRNDFVEVVRKIARGHGAPIETIRTITDASEEKRFRNNITYVTPQSCFYDIDEDPRSGQELIAVPEKFVAYYAPLVPKILHWFGGCFHLTKDWKGTILKDRRGCWITATGFFLSLPDGPQPDGRDIRRAIGIEYLRTVFSGKGGELGMTFMGGPAQPDLAVVVDSIEAKEKIIHILRECFYFRTKRSLQVVPAENFPNEGLQIQNEKEFKPQLFVMKTKADLIGLLRDPV